MRLQLEVIFRCLCQSSGAENSNVVQPHRFQFDVSNKQHCLSTWRGQPEIFLETLMALSRQQYFVWDTASESTK